MLVAACNPPGLTIEVVIDDPNIEKVELFAGASCGSDCPLVTAPPGLLRMPVDAAFVIDDPRPFVVEQKDFSDGVAGFRIESPHDTTLAIVVALAYDAQDQITASWSRQHVDIPDGDTAHWRIELDPTAAIGPALDPQPAGTERAAYWPNPSGGPACLLLEHWGDNFVATRELLGPVDDRDCDGVPATAECAPWIPNALGAAPTIADVNCVTPTLVGTTDSVCMLGGPECTEDPAAPRDQCVPAEPSYCTPSTLCLCKDSTAPAACLLEQITDATNNVGSMPFVKCTFYVDANGEQCDSTRVEIDVGAVLSGSGSSAKCTALRLNDSDTELLFRSYWHIGDGKLYLDSFTTPCKANVTWEGSSAPTVNIGLMDAELDNGYHLVLPVRADFQTGCSNPGPSMCTFVSSTNTSESMYACAAARQVMNQCAADPDTLCDGPMCNGQCCPAFEMCTPNGCSCGGGPSCTSGDHCENGGPPNELACGQVCCGVTKACPL
jgi:hypothetical protein